MFERYEVEVSFKNNVIYNRSFKSINQVVKFLAGFSYDCYFICTDLLTERIFSCAMLKEMIKEICCL